MNANTPRLDPEERTTWTPPPLDTIGEEVTPQQQPYRSAADASRNSGESGGYETYQDMGESA